MLAHEADHSIPAARGNRQAEQPFEERIGTSRSVADLAADTQSLRARALQNLDVTTP